MSSKNLYLFTGWPIYTCTKYEKQEESLKKTSQRDSDMWNITGQFNEYILILKSERNILIKPI